MKKIILALIALMLLGSLLVADEVTKIKEGEKNSILSGYAEVFDNVTNTWHPDAGTKITGINLYNSNGTRVGYIYGANDPVTDGLGQFDCPEDASHFFWFQWQDNNGIYHHYNFNDVAYIDFTYRGTLFTANLHDTVHLKFVQGY